MFSSGINVRWRGTDFFYIFICLAFLVPNHYQPWFNFYSEYLAFVGIFLFWVFSKKESLVFGAPVLGLLFFVLVVWVQLFFSIIRYSEFAWVSTFYLMSAVLAFMLGRQDGVVKQGALCFIFLGVLSSGIALGQWFDIWESVWFLTSGVGQRATANVGQANHLVTLLGLSVVAALWLKDRLLIGRVVFLLVIFWLVVGMVVAASRMAFVQYFFIGVFWYLFSGRRDLRSVCIYVFGFFALLVGGFWQADLAVALHLVEADWAAGLLGRMGSVERLAIWWQLLLAAWDKGGLGYGWGQVAAAQVEFALIYPVPIFTLHSHNIVIDLLVWNGFLIGSLSVVLIGFWLAKVFLRVRGADQSFAMVSVGVILIHALLEYPLEYSYFLLPFFVFLGYLAGRNFDLSVWVARFFSVVCLLVLVVFWREYRNLEDDFRMLRFEMARVGVTEYSVSDKSYVFLNGMESFMRFMRMQSLGGVDERLVEGHRLVHSYPHVPTFYRYVLLLIESGDYEEGVDALNRMRSMHGDSSYMGVVAVLKRDSVTSPRLLDFIKFLESRDGL
jgi:hypothetical protein